MTDVRCPVCGYYCLGKGGHGCIDKPSMIEPGDPDTTIEAPPNVTKINCYHLTRRQAWTVAWVLFFFAMAMMGLEQQP